jgi:tetratricopeptide (TPR) repeat protein
MMKNKSLLLAAFATLSFTSLLRAATPLDEARAAFQAHDLTKAELLLTPLTGADAQDAAAFHTFSQVRMAQKKTKAAIELAEKATTLDPTTAEYFAQLGRALGQRMGEIGFMQQAFLSGKLKGAFEKTLELEPQNIAGLIGLSRWYVVAPKIAGGSLEKAEGFARRVQALDPFLGELELGNVTSHDDKADDALAHYEKAAKLKPYHGYAQYLCGQMLLKLEKKDEARARFETALKLDPHLHSAKQALAKLTAPAS